MKYLYIIIALAASINSHAQTAAFNFDGSWRMNLVSCVHSDGTKTTLPEHHETVEATFTLDSMGNGTANFINTRQTNCTGNAKISFTQKADQIEITMGPVFATGCESNWNESETSRHYFKSTDSGHFTLIDYISEKTSICKFITMDFVRL